MRRRRSVDKPRVRGVTLIEVLIVVVLIAVLAGTIVSGTGMLGSSRLRAAATLVISTVRFAGTRANATGKPVRIAFDFEKRRIIVEEAASSKMLRDTEKGAAVGAEAANDAEQEALAEVDRLVKGPGTPRPKFSPLKEYGDDGRELGGDVRFRQVQTEHDDEPIIEGRAYLYFWPGGGTEWASIQLNRSIQDDGLSVMVSPLTGRARIERGRVALPERNMDGEIEEREEP